MKVKELTKTDFKNYIAGNILNKLYLSKGKNFKTEDAKNAHEIASEVIEFAEKYGLLDQEFNKKQ